MTQKEQAMLIYIRMVICLPSQSGDVISDLGSWWLDEHLPFATPDEAIRASEYDLHGAIQAKCFDNPSVEYCSEEMWLAVLAELKQWLHYIKSGKK